MTRRELLIAAAGAAGALGVNVVAAAQNTEVAEHLPPLPGVANGPFRGPYCLFSKHLPDLGWAELGAAVKQAGFEGIDLTVRPKGHVQPERVAEDLPRALEAIKKAGVEVPMITTALASADDPAAKPTFAAAAKAGIKFVKPDYYRYELKNPAAERAAAGRQLASLADLAGQHGVSIGYHNHTGLMGGPTLDFLPQIEALDAKAAGFYFDVRHAVVEGGGVGWKLAVASVLPRLKMISVKDAIFKKDAKTGRWKDEHVPMGEGFVDWPAFCALLAQGGFQGPISVHLEFPIEGATPEAKRANTLAAAVRELAFIKRHVSEAYA